MNIKQVLLCSRISFFSLHFAR